jgi:hypothetical protein
MIYRISNQTNPQKKVGLGWFGLGNFQVWV